MIPKMHSEQIKKVVGRDYAQKILHYFRTHTITRPSGRFYHKSDIYNVLNQQRSNEALEAAIFDCLEYYLQKREKELQRRQQLINTLRSDL